MIQVQTSDWQKHESDVAEILGLEQTVASGSQWHDVGDAVDRGHPRDVRFGLLADAKCTEKKSFAVNAKFMLENSERAIEFGKRFILPLRFIGKNDWGVKVHRDYVVLGLDDFAELLELARGNG